MLLFTVVGCGPYFRDAYPSSPSPAAYEWYLHAQIAKERGDNERALEMINRAIAASPTTPLYVERAELLRRSGQVEAALSSIQRIIEKDPTPDGLLVRARCEHTLNQPERALKSLEAARALDPQRVEVLDEHASLLLEVGRVEEARETLLVLVEHHPTQARAWRRLGDIAFEHARYQASIDAFETVLRLSIRDEAVFLKLAAAYQKQGHAESAREVLERCIDTILSTSNCHAELQRMDEP